ncbi:MAG: hypothetical protein CMG74_07535 [Candidatus Marinimicrobia bacterium]|nr:hypothetical protein [Candidatus Neomarinimicrobiota bacterium]|tara:strand:- start:3446 stop:4468 length:1023 start_codon:yes stop_codon:yes gene_type:complete
MYDKSVYSNPLISVVMPVYNDASYLNQAIDSILYQTFSDFEFIIINDGSTDNSFDIITSYEDPRIILLNNKTNLGISKSLNYGLGYVKGQFVARMDASDIALPKRFEKQIKYLKKEKGIGLVTCFHENINPEGDSLDSTNRNIHPKDSQVYTFFRNYITHSSVMINLDIIPEIKYNEDCAAEDFELWMRLSEKTEFYIIPTVLMKIRIDENGLSQRNKINCDSASKRIINNILKRIGVDANKREIDFHFQYHKKYKYTSHEGEFILQYLEKLFIGNQNSKVFRESSFSDFIFANWFHVIKYIDKINIRLLFIILRSELFYCKNNKSKFFFMRVLFNKVQI